MSTIMSVVIVLVGWVVVHRLNTERDRELKRLELVTQFLIEAYRSVAAISHVGPRPENASALSRAFFDIQLFGSREQIEAARRIAIGLSRGETVELDPLLTNLRQTLRNSLSLDPVDGNIWTWV